MEWYKILVDSQFWMGVFDRFSMFAPLVAIGLVMIESFVPILPLSVFVAINIMALGFWQGFIYSWIGNVVGSFIVFQVIRKFGQKLIQSRLAKTRRIKNIFAWIEKHGYFPIFLLLSFPFAPSFIISGVCALTGIRTKVFLGAIMFSKIFMILSLSFVGYNISSFIHQPVKSGLFILMTLSISFIAKIIFAKHEKHIEKTRHKQEHPGEVLKKKASWGGLIARIYE